MPTFFVWIDRSNQVRYRSWPDSDKCTFAAPDANRIRMPNPTMTNNDPSPQASPDFEQSLAELESIVQAMETGELTLEDSLAAFERGIRLTRACQQALDGAEQRIRQLTAQTEDAPLVSFDDHG